MRDGVLRIRGGEMDRGIETKYTLLCRLRRVDAAVHRKTIILLDTVWWNGYSRPGSLKIRREFGGEHRLWKNRGLKNMLSAKRTHRDLKPFLAYPSQR